MTAYLRDPCAKQDCQEADKNLNPATRNVDDSWRMGVQSQDSQWPSGPVSGRETVIDGRLPVTR